MHSQKQDPILDLRSIQGTFDAIAAEFDITRYKPWPQTEEFIASLEDNSTILDLGCGNGRNVKYLLSVNRGFNVIGLDFSKPMLRIAKHKIEQLETNTGAHFTLAEALHLPLANSSVDAVIYVAALHHIPGADQRRASLNELARVLRPGGRAFISVWEFEQERFKKELEEQLTRPPTTGEFGDVLVPWTGKRGQTLQRFYHLFYADELEKLIKRTNLKILTIFEASENYHAVVEKASDSNNKINPTHLTKTPFERIQDKCKTTLDLPDPQLELLPVKWERLGEVLVLKLNERLEEHWADIAQIYADVLGSKAVLRRTDKVRGTLRKPGVELLVGNETETIHTENKVRFKLDPMRVMYSSGNIDERIRISTKAKPDETVVDMFAGIGYFSVPLAVHSGPKKIISSELNPVAHEYLVQNIALNKVTDIVEPLLGDNRECLPEGVADRVVMGYLKSEHSHRIAALKLLQPTGGVVHFHDAGFSDEAIDSGFNKFQGSLKNSEFKNKFKAELFDHYKIKSYGPKILHVVLDIRVSPV